MMMIKKCRVCSEKNLTQLFTLGQQYISDFVPSGKAYKGLACPITLVMCTQCKLVQLLHSAPAEMLYSSQYWYQSGVTETMQQALKDVVTSVSKLVTLEVGDVVLDIGSNDGTLLRAYEDPWLVKVGFEPSKKLAVKGSAGINLFVNDFWSADLYLTLCIAHRNLKKAKIITAIGMLYDLEDPNKFLHDVSRVLHPSGIFVAQLMTLRAMIDTKDVGNLCHEHLEHYSFRGLQHLFEKNGLTIFDVKKNAVNGRSYRVYARGVQSVGMKLPENSTDRMYAAIKEDYELDKLKTFDIFYYKITKAKIECRSFIIKELAKGKTVWVYGASTKGNVILQWYELNEQMITGAADRSPSKWGKVTAGSNIPIVSEEEARAKMPDYFLVLPYAFLPEFIEREKDMPWRVAGGKFIVPLPEFRVL